MSSECRGGVGGGRVLLEGLGQGMCAVGVSLGWGGWRVLLEGGGGGGKGCMQFYFECISSSQEKMNVRSQSWCSLMLIFTNENIVMS